MKLDPAHMPPLVRAAEELSEQGQRRTLFLAGSRLVAGVGAAVSAVAAASTDQLRVLAWAAATLFLIALMIEVVRVKTTPERDWYDGRAVAESGKSLAWLYCICGDPFEQNLSNAEADELLLERLSAIRTSRPAARLDAIADPTISQSLRDLREPSSSSPPPLPPPPYLRACALTRGDSRRVPLFEQG